MSTESDARTRARKTLEGESVFAACPSGVIEEVLRQAHVISLARNDVVYRQGDKGDSMMVVISGSLKVTNVTADGKEVVLGFLRSGAMIGEIAVLDGRERTASVIALEPTEAVAIYRRDLVPILHSNPEVMVALMEGLCARLRSTISLVESYSLDAAARIADCLVRLAAEHGEPAGTGIAIDLRLTQRDIGSHLGLTRETVSRTLGEFRDNGLIEFSSSTIIIHDGDGLSNIAEGISG